MLFNQIHKGFLFEEINDSNLKSKYKTNKNKFLVNNNY